MDTIIERKEAIHKEEENDYTTATVVQSRCRVLDDRVNGVEFILSTSPNLMNIANLCPKEILVEMYNEIAPCLSAVEEDKEELGNSAILTDQRSKTNEPELIELFEQNCNSLVQEIEEYLVKDGIEKVSIDNVRELCANDNTILDMNSKFGWTLTQEHFQLSERMKGDHLAKEHCLYLSQIFRKHPDHKNLICRAYKISRSTYLRIMGNSIHTKTKSEIDSILPKQNNKIKPEVREHIENMVRPPKFPVTLSKIRNEVFQKFDI